MKETIESLIRRHVLAGDEEDVTTLETILHPQHRVILNRFRGSDTTTILSRQAYLDLLRAGNIGGQPRRVDIQRLDVFDHTASAKVVLENDKQRFETYYLFVKEGDAWMMITDMPVLKSVSA